MMAAIDAFGTIRTRLLGGFGAIMALLAAAAIFAWFSTTSTANDIAQALASVQHESQISSRLSVDIAQEIQAGAAYVEDQDTASEEEFRRLGWDAHSAQREMNNLPGQSAKAISLVAAIDSKLSTLEVQYALAHRLTDLGRTEAARAELEQGRQGLGALTADIDQLEQMKTARVNATADRLRAGATRRSLVLAALMAMALLVAALVVLRTVRSIDRPLRSLVRHARQLSSGDLTAYTASASMPGELRILADAMNQTGESLAKVVAVVARTADEVAGSANDLAAVSGQISDSASHVASAMTEVSTGAESQVGQLREIDCALQVIGQRAADVLAGAEQVDQLSHAIESTAQAKRSEIEHALAILVDVKSSVQTAAEEVGTLNRTATAINNYVETVSRIAEQTNLLALNAAIEAARAGQAGRGFAVVADEVRKLAVEARSAAGEVNEVTRMIVARVASTSQAMEVGASRVVEIEHVSHEIDVALATISEAAERTSAAAASVTAAAEENARAMSGATDGVTAIARTAEAHASAAQEVSASSQEQSAACEEMSAASANLLKGSVQLRELVGGLKVG
ncbi:MAG TPA: methyl-accepting chemotaxis protein [Gemmatimonadaceae bacterium]|nr:methyl-accepting chemotaxis protein [Gemmatimonadaceae bacterium]